MPNNNSCRGEKSEGRLRRWQKWLCSAVLFYIGCSGKASLRKQSEWRTKESEGLKLSPLGKEIYKRGDIRVRMRLLLLLSRFSRVRLCATPWRPHQAPPSLGFSRQEHWRGCVYAQLIHFAVEQKLTRYYKATIPQ